MKKLEQFPGTRESLHKTGVGIQSTGQTQAAFRLAGTFVLSIALAFASTTGFGLKPYGDNVGNGTSKENTTLTRGKSSVSSFLKIIGRTDAPGDASVACVRETNDDGFILAGYTSDYGAGDDDIYLLKTDPDGNIIWTKTYGGTFADDATDVIQTSDNGFAITGYTLSYGGRHAFLLKTDESGMQQFFHVFGTLETLSIVSGSSLLQTYDGGYLIAGYVSRFGAGMDDFYLLKTDGMGNAEWQKTFGGPKNDEATCVTRAADGGYLIGGNSMSYGDTLGSVLLVKTDMTGNLLWSRNYAPITMDASVMLSSIQLTSDNGIILAGVLNSPAVGENGWLLKTDMNGVQKWTRLYGTGDPGSDASFASVQETGDGGYIAAGYISNFGAGGDDYYLVKTNYTGDTMWTRTYGSPQDDDANYVMQSRDGGYVVAGSTFGSSDIGESVLFLKTDENGISPCSQYPAQTVERSVVILGSIGPVSANDAGAMSINAPVSVSSGGEARELCFPTGTGGAPENTGSTSVSPNPFTTQTKLTLGFEATNALIRIFDAGGREMRHFNFSGTGLILDRRDLPDGIYFYMIQDDSGILAKGKLIAD